MNKVILNKLPRAEARGIFFPCLAGRQVARFGSHPRFENRGIPAQNKILNQVPVDYYAKGVKSNIFQKYWHNKKWKTLDSFLKGSKGRLLDIGCADGTTTNEISKIAPELKLTGVDLYKETIKFAKKGYPKIEFVYADAHLLPFKSSSFDYAAAIEVLEHLEKPEVALAEIRRVLKRNGKFLVVQDTNSLLFKIVWWFWNRWKGSVWENSHISCVRPNKLVQSIKKAGFKIKKIKYTNLKMEIFILAEKL